MELSQNQIVKNVNSILTINTSDRHSYFQLKNFLVGKEPTNQSKMWRCVKELKVRKDSVDSILLEIEEIEDNIELLNISKNKINKTNNSEYDEEELKRINQIKKRKIERKIKSLEKNKIELESKLKGLIEECDFLSRTFFILNEKEELKDQDDPEENIKYWNAKLNEEYNLKIMFKNQDTELIKTILSLDNNCEIKKNVINLINNLEYKNDNKNIES